MAAFSRDTLCEAAVFLADTATMLTIPDAPTVWVLLVLTTNFDESSFITCLDTNHLDYERSYYPGERNLALYKIIPNPGRVPKGPNSLDEALFVPLIKAIADLQDSSISETVLQEIKYLPDDDGGFWLRLGIEMAAYRQNSFAAAAFCNAARSSLGSAARLAKLAAQLGQPLDSHRLAETALQFPETEVCQRLRNFMSAAYYTEDVGFVKSLGLVNASCSESCVYAGIAAHKSGNHADAVSWFRKYPAIATNAPPEVVEAYGISLTETKEYAEAVRVLKEGIETWPDYHWLYMRLGIAEAVLGNHDAALSELRISYEHAPDNGYLVYLMIESLVELGQYEEAASLAEKPVLKSETDTWILWARWRAFTGAGKDGAGEAVFTQLVELMPELQPFYQYLYVDAHPEKVRELINAIEGGAEQVFPETYMLLERMEQKK